VIVNLEYDAQAQAAPQSFRDGMQQAANALDAAYTNNITINIAVGYGEFLGHALPNQNTSEGNIDYNGADGEGFFPTYQTLRSLLISHATSADQQTAYADDLPNTANLQGQTNFIVGSAQWKALGQLAGNNAALDGAVGMGANFTGDVLFNGALHELTHAMGRIAGTSLDMFRFNEDGSGNRVFGGAIPATAAYFSIDGGATELADFGINSDPGDWLNGGVQGSDPFNEIVGTGGLSAVDLTEMNVLGFARTISPPPPPPQAPTTAALVQDDKGYLDYLGFFGTSLVQSALVSSPVWKVMAEGDFNNDGNADLVTQDPNSGSIDIIFSKNGNIQSSLLEQGRYSSVVGAGNFDGSGRTAIATQDSASGQIDLLWFTGTQLTSSELLIGSYQHVVGTTDVNGDGKTDFVTQSPSGGPLDFLFFNNANLVGSALTPDAFWPVHDVANSGVAGQSVMLSQDQASGQLDFLDFNGTRSVGSLLEAGSYLGQTPVQGSLVASQYFNI
jgi:hypothetical protein